MIPREYVNETCKMGQAAACCRYLIMGGAGMECAKGTGIGVSIDARVAAGTFTAQGDNCPGYAEVLLSQ